MRSRLSYSNVMATIAVFIALGGSSYAAIKVTGKNVKDASLTGKDVRNSSLTSSDVKNGSLLAKDIRAGQLTGGGDGAPGQDATAPAGAVMFFDRAGCPSGWSEFAQGRGRYIVGLPAGGTLKGTSGTALSDLESRPVGQHSHSGTFSHVHAIPTVTGGGATGGILFGNGSSVTVNTGVPNSAIFTTENAGNVPGTNAPYIQLRACRKD